jgi:hypothetical protein
MVDVTAAPAGVTEAGANEQLSFAGRTEQLKFTAWANPFSGVTVSAKCVDCPARMDALDGETVSVKPGVGGLIVYVAVATTLLAYPLATAIASIVSVLFTAIAVVYFVDPVVGVVPFVV